LESLEDRLAPAVINWDGGPGGTGTNWNDPVNWVGDVLPGVADDIVIGSAFAGITLTTSNNVAIHSMTSAAALQVNVGTFAVGAATSRIDSTLTVSGGTLRLSGTTLNGTGTLTNSATMELTSSTVNAALANQGMLRVQGVSAVTGDFSNEAASVLRVDGNTSVGFAGLTMAQGFSNHGTVELTGAGGHSSQLTVSSGTLTNAAGGTVRVSASGPGPNGARTLAVQLDNQGTFVLQTDLTLSKPSAAHNNSGTIQVTGGNLTLPQTGTVPSFTNTGVIDIGSGRTFSISGGTFNYHGGVLTGPGTLPLSGVTVNLDADLNNATVGTVTLTSCTVNGPGTLINAGGKTLTLTGSTVNAALLNQGTLLAQGITVFNGAFSNAAGSVLRVDGNSSTSFAGLTVVSGFSNQGTVELTGAGGHASQLTVTNGTLTNTAGGTVRVSASGPGPIGSRTLAAQLDNQGTLQTQVPLSLTKPSAAHNNSGTIQVTGGNLTLPQTGTTPSFTNTGTIDVGGEQTFSISGGTLNSNGGALTGAGTLPLTGVTVNLGADLRNGGIGAVTLTSCTVNGPGTLINAAGKTLSLTQSTLNASLDNRGTLLAQDASALIGSVMTAPGSLLRVDGNSSTGFAGLTVASGFSNEGTVELTGAGGHGSQLAVSNGTLTNTSGGTVRVSASGPGPIGPRTLAAQLDNQGTLVLQTGLTLSKPSAAHSNSGTIRVAGGNLTVSQSGTTPSFTNTGVIDVAANRTLTISAGGLTNHGPGILTGHPSGTFAISGNLAGGTSNADFFAPAGIVRLTGPGSAANPQLLEVLAQDRGVDVSGFADNFALGTLTFTNTFVRLVDHADNAVGTEAEALYVNTLLVPSGTTLDLNGLRLYARQIQISGTVVGGTVTQVLDGGSIVLNAATPGTVAVTGETDEWTFFGRAGRSVTVVVNPGTAGEPPVPLPPSLNFADVRLLSPSGAVVASGTSATSGQIVTLLGVELPEDGTYRVQVRAAAGGDRGNYVLAVWNGTVDTMPVLLNQQTSGVVESPFSVDRWTFAARANQQVRFDWINAAPASIQFKLTGPSNFTGFSGLTGDSGLVTLPADGTYVLQASAGTGPGGSYAFRLVETNETDLSLGTAYAGTLIGSGQAQLFRVSVPAGQQLRVVLDDSASGNRNELYARFGAAPTRGDYQFSSDTSGASADQQLVVPSPTPGTWYVLLYGDAIPTPSAFTLTATAGDILLFDVTPDRHGNGTDMVLTLIGAGFERTTVVELVAAGGTVYSAGAVSIDLPMQLTATFVAGSVPPGTYSIRARRGSGGSAELAGAFEVLTGGQPRLETNLILPSSVGRHQLATIYVEYANTGSAAMPAPLLAVQGSDRALLTLDDHRLVRGFWTSAVPDGFAEPDANGISTIQILGSGATPGVLQPGERIRVPVYFAGLLQPWDFSDSSVAFVLGSLGPDDTTPINWPLLETGLRPPSIPADAWGPIYANVTAQIGATWGDYARVLADNAQYLGRLGQRVVDVSQLWTFEVEQAIGLSALAGPADVTDIQVEAPGLPITFRRVFASNLIGRYEQGPLGRGWAWAHGWQHSLTVEPDGTTVVAGMNGGQRRFEPDSRRAGAYFSEAGDHATLTALGGSIFVLREPNGLVTHFRNDGRVDFVEDPNGNRITATWTGAELTRLQHSAGQFVEITYDAGRLASVTDHSGRTVAYSYDSSGEHLLSVQGIDGQTTRYNYSTGAGAAREHALLSVEHPDGTHEFFAYDARGRLESVARDDNAERQIYAYDSAGRVTAMDALGGATSYYFDHRGLLAAVEDALGRRTLLNYDRDFNLTSAIDPLGQSHIYQYDGRGNLIRSTNPLGQVTSFTYTTAFNRRATMIDARGNPLHYGYDGRGNLTSITYADGSVERFAVEADGQIDTWTNRRGQLIDYRTSDDGRIERKDLPGGDFVEYRYNARGNLEQTIDASGTTTLEYLDVQNPDLPTKITYSDGRFLQYAYQDGRRTQMVDADGATVNYVYDVTGRLEFLRDRAGNLIVQYAYDAIGRLQREDKGNGTFTEYVYDAAGQLEHLINHAPDGTVNSRFDHVYDDLSRRTRMTTPQGVWDYTYDGVGQLTGAVFTSSDPATIPHHDLHYVYDAAGNRTRTIINSVTTDYTANNLNQYTSVGTSTFAFDLDGNLMSRTEGGITTTYSYDAENRLTGVAVPGATWAYQYDALGNRSASVHNGEETVYLVDPFGLGDVVAEHNGNGGLIAHYTHGLGLVRRTDNGDVPAYYDFDALGSTVGLTGPAGAYLNRYSYLPHGEALASVGAIANPFAFAGAFGVMRETHGLDFMRARFYSPTQGRFTTPDPIGLSGGDANLYRYVSNDPVNQIDPSGMKPLLQRAWDALRWGWDKGKGVLGEFGEKLENGFDLIGDVLDWGYDELKDWWGTEEETRDWVRRVVDETNKYFPPVFDVGGDIDSSGILGSFDPNQKTGPAGFGLQGFIAAESLLPYRIDFENEASATAPAQRVVITDQLDADLDWDTFAWMEVGFGDVYIPIPAGSRHFQTTVPMRQGDRTFQVEIELSLNSLTGLVTAVFQSIDPATSLPPDVLTGFLPPEDRTGRGQGHISYIVQPKPGLATGTQIRNVALITFDINEPIATNQVDPHDPSTGTDPAKEARNTIDADRPVAAVGLLPAVSRNGTFHVYWDGYDPAGAGYDSTDVFVSVDGGPYQIWQSATRDWSATFTGERGHQYDFVALGRDLAGNVQEFPAGAQTSVVIPNGPTAVDDAYAAKDGKRVNGNVVSNDINPAPRRKVTAVVVDEPSQGTLVLQPSGAFTYTPLATGWPGRDSFTYKLRYDGGQESKPARVDLATHLVQFRTTTARVSEKNGTATLNVDLNRPATEALTVEYVVVRQTARGQGEDFALAAGTLAFAVGERSKTITVALTNDIFDEHNETLQVWLTATTGPAAVGPKRMATVIILDDDALPKVSFRTKASAGTEDRSPALEVFLSAPSGRPATVKYKLAAGTAKAGSDFTLVPGALTFAPGQTSHVIPVAVVNDTADEPFETVRVTLFGAIGAGVGPHGTHTYTIQGDDPLRTVEFDAEAVQAGEAAGTVELALRLSAPASFLVSVTYAVDGGSASPDKDFVVTAGRVTFRAGESEKKILVRLINDLLDEPTEIVRVRIATPTNAALGLTDVLTLTIDDDDAG
jgi:RHS repeat-associated protein